MAEENTAKDENTFDFDTFAQTVQGQRKLKEWLDTEDGKDILQPRLDSFFTKGLKTWQENNLDKIKKEAQEEVRKELQPDETPEQKRVRELEEAMSKRDLKDRQRELFDLARKTAADKNIPETIVEKFIGQDEDETKNNITSLIDMFDNLRRTAKEEALNTVSRDVVSPTAGGVNIQETTKKIMELQKTGKTVEAMALRRELSNQQA